MRAKLLTGVAAAALCLIADVFGAEFSLSDNGYVLTLRGEIKRGDYSKLAEILKGVSEMPRTLALDSRGGNVEEAIKLGRFFRRALFQSVIAQNGVCNSACFVLWASAARRFPVQSMVGSAGLTGRIGLHRPFFGRDKISALSTTDARESYKNLEEVFRAYLREINVPTDVVETLMRTKSTDIHYVPDIKLVDLMGQEAPFFEEWLISKCGELAPDEEYDYSLLVAADLMKLRGSSLEPETPGAQALSSMSDGYKSYLRRKGSEINTCRFNAEKHEAQKILREFQG